MHSSLQILLLAGVFCLVATIARADSEIVIAIRYLHAQGTSHSHLYLYREDGEFLRRLTNDNSGQDSGPVFSPNGETIIFAREKPNNVSEFWSVEPSGTDLKKLDAAPDWYEKTKSSPDFINAGRTCLSHIHGESLCANTTEQKDGELLLHRALERKTESRSLRVEKSAAICYGTSMYRPGLTPAVITLRRSE